MSYNVQQDKFVFGVTPAPSPLNTDQKNWRAYLNDSVDEINIVDEKTNLLVGTIGGQASYRYQRLPKTTLSIFPYNETESARGYAWENFTPPLSPYPYFFLSNGNLAEIDFSSNHFNNGAIIYDCYDLETTDPNNGYWVAFRPSDADPTILEKIAEVKQTDDFYNNGYAYTYQTPTNPNQCKFIRLDYPNTDGTALFSKVTTLTISGTSVGSTITVTEVDNNFGGQTVLSLYNANAPVPVAPGTANWNSRTPIYTGQDDYYGMMNGVNEGWVWYKDDNSASVGFAYIVGYNILTGATTFINPIATLSSTTNFNPLGPVTVSNLNTITWESHPAGVVFFAANGQSLDNGNNTNDVTATFSPQWVNNTKVVFLNGRNAKDGSFINTGSSLQDNASGFAFSYGFDSLHLVEYSAFNNTNQGAVMIMYRYALDTTNPLPIEAATTALANPGYDSGIFGYDWNDTYLLLTQSTEESYNQNGPSTPIWSQSEYFVWPTTSSKMSQLQSNNPYYPVIKIGNRFYGAFNDYNLDCILFGLQYDTYTFA